MSELKSRKMHLLYDDQCQFCCAIARWAKAQNAEIEVWSVRSTESKELLKTHGIHFIDLQTVYFVEGAVYARSRAAFQMLRHTHRPWRWLALFRFLPAGLCFLPVLWRRWRQIVAVPWPLLLMMVCGVYAFKAGLFDHGASSIRRRLALLLLPLGVLVAAAARAAGVSLKLVAFDEETRPDLVDSFAPADRRTLLVGQLGKMLKSLREFDAGYAIMAGQITPRRLFKGLHPDLKAVRILASLKRRNAETIFGAIAREIEDLGITLLDARSFLEAHVASAGCMTGKSFPIEREYLDHGIHIAREAARLDIGQGCVVRQGTVLAVEAFEGTDEMLRRAGAFKTDDALFVKTVKARQDWRFDVPCFGTRTLETMRDAHLNAAALEAGKVLMLDKPAVLTQARAWGISLFGFE